MQHTYKWQSVTIDEQMWTYTCAHCGKVVNFTLVG